DKWNIADDWDFIFRFLDVFTHQATQHHCLPVPYANVCCYLARAEYRLINHVVGEKNWRGDRYSVGTSKRADTYRINGTAIINEAFKLHDLRHQVEIDGRAVWPYHWFHFQRHARISSFKGLRRR